MLILDCTIWPSSAVALRSLPTNHAFHSSVVSGVEILDQALQGAKSILNGNENSAMFLLCPVSVGKVDQHAIMTKKRLLEDKTMSILSCYDVPAQFYGCPASLSQGTLTGWMSLSILRTQGTQMTAVAVFRMDACNFESFCCLLSHRKL